MSRAPRRSGIIAIRGANAFVALDDPQPGEEDVFLPPGEFGEAMDGDAVEVETGMSRGRPAGRVTRVLERRRREIVGVLDIRRREPVLIARQCTEPVRLSVDRAFRGEGRVEAGMCALAEITAYPTEYAPACARLVRVLGPAGEPAVELEASRLSHGLADRFPADVMKEVSDLPDALSAGDLAGREDLRGLNVFTIDPPDARDFDDALSLEVLPAGGHGTYRIGIHVADVSHYVKRGSALDREARKRATSTYLPGRVIPMLPERLSNGLCSLVEGQDRLAVSVLAELDESFEPVSMRHARTVIRSRRRFTYDEVDGILARDEGDCAEELRLFRSIAESRWRDRMARGAIDLDLPEEKPILDLDGRVIEIRRIDRTWSHRLIEELMVMANEYAAEAMRGRGIYRVHEEPTPVKIRQFRQLSAAMGGPHRGSIMSILAHFRDRPCRRVMEMRALRSLQEARYSAVNYGHYGLALEAYSHFTSPIRRYPDLVAHRLLVGEGERGGIEATARHSSVREREAMEAERDALLIKYLEYAATRQGDAVTGVVEAITRDGLALQLDFGPRALLRQDDLGGDVYRYDRDALALVGRRTGRRYALGDALEVVIASVDIAERRLYVVPERAAKGPAGRAERGRAHAPGDDRRRGRSGPRKMKRRGRR